MAEAEQLDIDLSDSEDDKNSPQKVSLPQQN